VKPGIPIPADATRVHSISNTDVQHCPGFDSLAPALLDFLGGCDLCGYNIRQLDVCMLK
jgi:DNA polymerase-3 subunit epsilon